MRKIELDLRRDLAKVIVNPDTLGDCRYTAPCAIGAMMTPEQRADLAKKGKDHSNIGHLNYCGLISIPEDQFEDARDLQRAFDRGDSNPLGFETTLARLKEKYLGQD